MTNIEICSKYREMFTLIIETVGETENSKLADIEKYLDSEDISLALNNLAENDAPFPVYVTSLLVYTVIYDLGMDELNTTEVESKVFKLYKENLEKPTRKFMTKYGVPMFNLEETVQIIVKSRKNLRR